MIEALIVNIIETVRKNKGQSIVEYGFIIFMIAMAVTLALGTMGEKVVQLFNSVTF